MIASHFLTSLGKEDRRHLDGRHLLQGRPIHLATSSSNQQVICKFGKTQVQASVKYELIKPSGRPNEGEVNVKFSCPHGTPNPALAPTLQAVVKEMVGFRGPVFGGGSVGVVNSVRRESS